MTTPSVSTLAQLAGLRGAFHLGHTDGDVSQVLSTVKELTGVHLAVVWGFNDMWGLGGDSDLVMVQEGGAVCDAPVEWWRFLYDPKRHVDASTLAGLAAGEPIENGDNLIQFGSFNYAWRDEPNEDLG